ncbi:MAG: aspartate aminotransferase family protein [Phycisphaerales bacterium]|nr:aspartate aminotransferase family protein [Phycisphaerales bacterium]
MSPDQFRAAAHQLIDWITDYWSRLDELPVLSRAKPGDLLAALPAAPPEQPEPFDALLADIDNLILPGLTNWQAPGFFAFFPANISPPAVLGELLSAGLGVNGMLWAASPAATEVEMRMLDWMAALLDLPAKFRWSGGNGNGGGCIQGTASESTLIAMLAARHRAVARGADPSELVAYTSTQAHSSVIKAAMIAGLARAPDDHSHLRLLDVDDTFALRPDLFSEAIEHDVAAGLTPFYICATVGTTSSTAIDPLVPIGELAHRHGAWLHVDAAHAGAACICPEHRGLLRGVESADSLCFNPHKWLLTSFDCDLFWTGDRAALTGALSITPEYLKNAASQAAASGGTLSPAVDFRDWQIPLGRRFRALKLWFVLRSYGAENLRAYIREHIRLATWLEEQLRADPRFELAAPRPLNLICFRIAPRAGESHSDADARSRELLNRLNSTGRVYLTHTVLPTSAGPRYTIRMCIGGTFTQERHVREAWTLIQQFA